MFVNWNVNELIQYCCEASDFATASYSLQYSATGFVLTYISPSATAEIARETAELKTE